MLKAPIRILIIAALCVAALVGLAVRESMARASGTEVLLAMEAVDPRSLLSGHYVIVALRERLEQTIACPAVSTEPGWIALRENGGHHSFSALAKTRQEAEASARLAVRGEILCSEPQPPTPDWEGAPGWIELQLGVDRFHINQTDAERIDRLLRGQTPGEQRIFAIVSIGRDGRARLRGLQVDGERLELSWS